MGGLEDDRQRDSFENELPRGVGVDHQRDRSGLDPRVLDRNSSRADDPAPYHCRRVGGSQDGTFEEEDQQSREGLAGEAGQTGRWHRTPEFLPFPAQRGNNLAAATIATAFMTPTIELQSLHKTFDHFVAVDEVSAAIPARSVFGLLGPNGAGKTTTLRMLMDIIAPDSGAVLFFGRKRRRSDLEKIGYLPEERGLYRKMTVTDHLVFLAQLHGVSRREALPAIDRMLERVELTRWSKSKVEELSKGMQQKIQLVGEGRSCSPPTSWITRKSCATRSV
jgi:ABC-type glutathione transport system ATPase component